MPDTITLTEVPIAEWRDCEEHSYALVLCESGELAVARKPRRCWWQAVGRDGNAMPVNPVAVFAIPGTVDQWRARYLRAKAARLAAEAEKLEASTNG